MSYLFPDPQLQSIFSYNHQHPIKPSQSKQPRIFNTEKNHKIVLKTKCRRRKKTGAGLFAGLNNTTTMPTQYSNEAFTVILLWLLELRNENYI